ncbi:MAG: hypothetical protein ROY99_11365 [Ignavibacterium sp.]|jgi:hypothetical protein|nr:hypothetical protein [Ignavibacterium sp.]
MKNIKFVFFFLSLLSVVLFISCSKSDSNNPVNPGGGGNNGGGGSSNEAKLTLNGDTFNNQVVTLKNGTAGYSVSDTATVALFMGTVNSDSLYFYIVFKGKQTGAQNWGGDFGVMLSKKSSSAMSYYLGSQQGTTTVSNYGAVGGKIEGSVSGKLILQTAALTEVSVSGNFSATRVPDVN